MDERTTDRSAESASPAAHEDAPDARKEGETRAEGETREEGEAREEDKGRETGWAFHPRRGGHSGLQTPPG